MKRRKDRNKRNQRWQERPDIAFRAILWTHNSKAVARMLVEKRTQTGEKYVGIIECPEPDVIVVTDTTRYVTIAENYLRGHPGAVEYVQQSLQVMAVSTEEAKQRMATRGPTSASDIERALASSQESDDTYVIIVGGGGGYSTYVVPVTVVPRSQPDM